MFLNYDDGNCVLVGRSARHEGCPEEEAFVAGDVFWTALVLELRYDGLGGATS